MRYFSSKFQFLVSRKPLPSSSPCCAPSALTSSPWPPPAPEPSSPHGSPAPPRPPAGTRPPSVSHDRDERSSCKAVQSLRERICTADLHKILPPIVVCSGSAVGWLVWRLGFRRTWVSAAMASACSCIVSSAVPFRSSALTFPCSPTTHNAEISRTIPWEQRCPTPAMRA